jgi:hypothetical protein
MLLTVRIPWGPQYKIKLFVFEAGKANKYHFDLKDLPQSHMPGT